MPVAGRVQRVETTMRFKVSGQMQEINLIFWNVHNFGLSLQDLDVFASALQEDQRQSMVKPGQVFVFCLGDFNFLRQGEIPLDLKSGEQVTTNRTYDAVCKRWDVMMSKFTELFQATPTRYDKASHTE
eukprot:8484085-Karenia_brevis.AAC.1